MSGENPAEAAEDPPPLANGESAASEKNDAEKYGSEESTEMAVTSNDANEVKTVCENGTECVTDEGTDTVETDDTNKANSDSANVVGAVDVKMVDTQHDAIIESVGVKMVETQCEANIEAVDVKMAETQHEASIEVFDVKVVETLHEANTEVEDVKMVDTKHETVIEAEDVKMVDTQHEANIEANDVKMVGTQDVKMVDTQHETNIDAEEDACQVKEGLNGDNQYDKASECEDTKMIEAKADTRSSEAQETRKAEKEGNTEEKTNHASGIKMAEKEDVCLKEEDKEGKNEDNQDAKVAEADEMSTVEAKVDARNAEAQGNENKEETKDKMEEKGNDANVKDDVETFGSEDVKIVDKEQNEEKKNVFNDQADDVKIVDKEDACRKEDKGRKTEDSHSAKVAEGGGIMMAESKSVAVHAEVKENKQKEEGGNKTEEKRIICMEKQDEDKIELAEVDKLELDNKEHIDMEMQDGLKEEEQSGFDKHEMSDREESVEESQQELKGEAKGNVSNREVDDREQNTEEKQEGLEEVERILCSNDVAAKNEQEGAAEEHDGEKWDRKVSAEKKEEKKQDTKLTAEKKDKIHDGKVSADKEEQEEEEEEEEEVEEEEEEEEEMNENVTSEKNEVGVIERGVPEKDEEMETMGNTTANKQKGEDNQIDDICKHEGQDKGTKRSNADIEEAENGSMSKEDKDGEATMEQAGESDKNMEEKKNGEHKSKKARIVTEKDYGKDKNQDDSKSREAKNLLSTPSPYSHDRPARARKTVERLVEVIEKEPCGSFILEKGRGTPLKNIPGVAKRISKKKPADLKFLHQILFGRLGKAVDFKSHILEFSGFVWHGSDEKHRAKAKEKLDKCSIETLLELCHLLSIPVSRVNSRKDDLVAKLLDFIAEPRAKDDSTLPDDQVSNSRKHKREVGSAVKNPEGTHKRSRKKYSESESDEDAEEGHEEDDHMKSDSEENKEDGEEVDSEQEDRYGRGKVKAGKKSVDGKGSTAKTKRQAITGISPKKAPVDTLSKCSSRVSSSAKSSKDKQRSAVDLNVVSEKSKPITPKLATNSEKETNERRSSGKRSTSKGKLAEAEQALPSKGELQKTIAQILKKLKVDFDNVTFSDVLKMLDKRYKMDLSSMKDTMKSMVLDELVKLAEADED